jgi:ferritin-like metal-binding protein YciE
MLRVAIRHEQTRRMIQMAKVSDPHDLFLHEMSVMHTAEKKIVPMLTRLEREANDPELKQAFARHLVQTQRHVEKLEDAFQTLGEQPKDVKAPGIEGLETQHNAFAAEASQDVSPGVLDSVAVDSAAHIEHYEIAAYESLITMAETMKAPDVAAKLKEILANEQEALQQGKEIGRRLAREGASEVAPA